MRSTDNLYAHLSDEDIDLLLASDTNSPTRRRGLERERAAREAPNVTQNLEAANSEFAVEPTVLYRTQPGPRDFGSGKATPGRDLTTPEEVAAYTRRTPISEATQEQMDAAQLPAAGGAYLPSQEDVDMYNRGLVYMYDPQTGTSGYTMAYPRAPEPHVGAPGRVGLRPDLERPVVDFRTGQPIEGTHKYEKTVVETPFGQQEAYRPSAAYRQQLDARQQARIRETLVRKSGLDAETAAGMDLEQLRAAGRDRREAELEARKAAVIRRAQERQNPLAQLDDEWRQYVLASQMLGRPAGASPTDVSRAHNEQLTALGLRVAQGQGFQQLTPEQQAMVGLKVAEGERNMPPEERAAKYRDTDTVHPSEVTMVDQYVSDHYSTPNSGWALGGLSSSFDAEEQAATVEWLVTEKGYRRDKAEALVASIARKRNSQSWWGNWDGE